MALELFNSKEMRAIADGFVSTSSCQIRTITSELLHNLNDWLELNPDNLEGIDKDYFIDCINDLVIAIRSSNPISNYALSQMLILNPEEFTTKANELSAENKKEIQYFYDNFWHHNNIAGLYNSGKIKDHTAFKFVSIEGAEAVAAQYLSRSFFKSKTLEYLLIDSMLFAETVEFANVVSDLSVQKFWSLVGHHSWSAFKFLFNEGVALIITAIVANGIDSSQGTNYWIVFATITIIRWLNPLKLERLKFKAKSRLLLGEMIGFYDAKFKHSEFNPKLTQELLFDLEKKGASYSHWVYHILDRRLKE